MVVEKIRWVRCFERLITILRLIALYFWKIRTICLLKQSNLIWPRKIKKRFSNIALKNWPLMIKIHIYLFQPTVFCGWYDKNKKLFSARKLRQANMGDYVINHCKLISKRNKVSADLFHIKSGKLAISRIYIIKNKTA